MGNIDVSPDLQTPRGKVVTIGQVKIPKIPGNVDIPVLHFIVIERSPNDSGNTAWPGGAYIATCIHLQIDGYGATISDACNDMVRSVGHYLHECFKSPECAESAWENIKDAVKSNSRMELLWDKYRILQLEFAKRGITTDRTAYLYDKIFALLDENRKLRAELSEKQSLISWGLETLISDAMDTMTMDCGETTA
ncbi:MAG: hypothetical protein LBB56_00290 [Chitinispirillales bacterium]|jgi:hypothetical protein|nr:hypothetical protein [Chitinispirillales bacterium]